ncbi:hypothetical protein BDZ89DRAFT_714246 [Hymenopellis radicata]|nr:hypothetical protein BDZ89DRAFT_714246 [Hymenopellis radicata]
MGTYERVPVSRGGPLPSIPETPTSADIFESPTPSGRSNPQGHLFLQSLLHTRLRDSTVVPIYLCRRRALQRDHYH